MQVEKQEAASGVRSEKALASVMDNSLGWGSFMLVSSNTRYQIVNTIEERLLVGQPLSQHTRVYLPHQIPLCNKFAFKYLATLF